MRKIIFLAICAVFALAANAQTNIDELKYLQDMFGMDKKHFVAERMQISKADSAKFWTLYDEYELFRSEIGEKRANNVEQYVDNYAKITDKLSDEIVKTSFEINAEFSKLLQKTYTTMSKELSATKAGQFLYLEMYFEALGRVKLSEIIPHIGVPEPTKK
jgi:hypothetical protein